MEPPKAGSLSNEQQPGAPVIFLQPGELFASETPALVKTVLGSCVAILIRAPRIPMAAMAHCLLPEAGVPTDAMPRQLALRFVDTTLDLMLRAFAKRGACGEELQVKLFGGAARITESGLPGRWSVGERNVNTALAVLASRGLSVMASSVGGARGRFIEFDTETGEVWVKILPAQLNGQAEGRG